MEYVSLEVPIEMAYQDEDYGPELDWGDCVTWAGRALGLINVPALYHEKFTGNSLITPNIAVTEYKGALPVDFHEVMEAGVRDAETKEVYHHASDTFHKAPNTTGEDLHHTQDRKTYQIKGGYIYISEETATLEMAYKAFMIDDRGFPMIPGKQRVVEAVKAYIVFRQDHKMFRKGMVSERQANRSESDWDWYIGSAQNALKIMSVDRREAWSKHWTRLIPRLSLRDYSYAYRGNQEDLNIGSGNS